MKKISTEFNSTAKAEGFTMTANISVDFIKALKRWNNQDGKAISQAIKDKDVKRAIEILKNAQGRTEELRKVSAKHDKIIYLNGKEWGIFEADTRKCYQFN